MGRWLVGRVGVTRWVDGWMGRIGRVGGSTTTSSGQQGSGSHHRMGALLNKDAQQAGCPDLGELPGERSRGTPREQRLADASDAVGHFRLWG